MQVIYRPPSYAPAFDRAVFLLRDDGGQHVGARTEASGECTAEAEESADG
jgi:hypothetical protein